MATLHPRYAWLLLSCLPCLAFGWSGPHALAENGGEAIAIIMSKDSGATDISLFLLKRVFGGDPTDFAGKRLVPFNYAPEQPARLMLDNRLLGLSADMVSRYWIDRRIRGQGLAPRTVPSPAVMKLVVARFPGAIGYVPAAQLDSSISVLSVDGKSVQAPDYPLR